VYDWDLWKLNGQERALCKSARTGCIRVLLAGHFAREKARSTFDDGDVGGLRDAFRHSYWNATMTRAVGVALAKSWGDAHENGYPENRATAGSKLLSDMDFFNNDVGRRTAQRAEVADADLTRTLVLAIERGDLLAVRYDLSDRNGKLVPTSQCVAPIACGT
jgi:hypothetical protein